MTHQPMRMVWALRSSKRHGRQTTGSHRGG
jgi:hypothetical protein